MEKKKFLPTLPSLLASPHEPLIHRDLSWLQFNERVLNEAHNPSNPLLERLKFLGITSSNLDEFFMIRVSSLHRSIRALLRGGDQAKLTQLKKIRSSIFETVSKFGVKQMDTFDQLTLDLATHGIQLVRGAKPGEDAHEVGKSLFEQKILPFLEPPEVFSPERLEALQSLQMGVLFSGQHWFRIPKNIPSVFWVRPKKSSPIFVFFLDDLLLTHLGSVFQVGTQSGILRVTRDGDFSVELEEEDPESIPDVVKSGLGMRDRGRITRIQYLGDVLDEDLNKYALALNSNANQVFLAPGTTGLHGLISVISQLPLNKKQKKKLRYPEFVAVLPKPFKETGKLFKRLKKRDFILHHPYDSFDAFILWIKTACRDPKVKSIQVALYRVDALSELADTLKQAAKKKKIRVVIELRARFDEQNNIRISDELRKAGAEVGFGFGNLKLHAKIAVISRKEKGKLKHYTHLSTGNYNAANARQYTDLAILTSHNEIGEDALHFFDSVSQRKVPENFKCLVTAPTALHRKVISLIDQEVKAAQAGKKAKIFVKANALVDEHVIERLYKASQAGVEIILVVRGACSLVPGVRGLSENIRVFSIVDRFLEHSRIYYFQNSGAIYLSSADWMPRNFFSRLEIAFPVLDPKLSKFLLEVVIPAYTNDNQKAMELMPQGTWKKRISRSGRKPIRAQFFLEDLAKKVYRGTPLVEEKKK